MALNGKKTLIALEKLTKQEDKENATGGKIRKNKPKKAVSYTHLTLPTN